MTRPAQQQQQQQPRPPQAHLEGRHDRHVRGPHSRRRCCASSSSSSVRSAAGSDAAANDTPRLGHAAGARLCVVAAAIERQLRVRVVVRPAALAVVVNHAPKGRPRPRPAAAVASTASFGVRGLPTACATLLQ